MTTITLNTLNHLECKISEELHKILDRETALNGAPFREVSFDGARITLYQLHLLRLEQIAIAEARERLTKLP